MQVKLFPYIFSRQTHVTIIAIDIIFRIVGMQPSYNKCICICEVNVYIRVKLSPYNIILRDCQSNHLMCNKRNQKLRRLFYE